MFAKGVIAVRARRSSACACAEAYTGAPTFTASASRFRSTPLFFSVPKMTAKSSSPRSCGFSVFAKIVDRAAFASNPARTSSPCPRAPSARFPTTAARSFGEIALNTSVPDCTTDSSSGPIVPVISASLASHGAPYVELCRSTYLSPRSVFRSTYAWASRGTWYCDSMRSVSRAWRFTSWMSVTLPITTPRSRTSVPVRRSCPARGRSTFT